jgi:hypothetical protein
MISPSTVTISLVLSSAGRGPLLLIGNSVGNVFVKNCVLKESVRLLPRDIEIEGSDASPCRTSADAA